MHKWLKAVIAAVVVLLAAGPRVGLAREKWPAPDPETKKQLAEIKLQEEETRKKIEAELAAQPQAGKPYIPQAEKPEDLSQATIPAFPGAEGAGRFSFGGRGGKVFVVTSLADSGPGTLREACEAVGPRIAVFNVAGIIQLKRPVHIVAPYMTIVGQTAPGDGVCVAGFTTHIDTHDVVIRYMRFRRGATNVFDRDDALGGSPVGNIIVDHCSASWGLDENLSLYRHMYEPKDGGTPRKLPTVNLTIQWCISTEALDPYNHAFGGTWGGRNTSFHHNLFSSNTGRNASIGMGYDFNWVNNVVFNWRHRTLDGGDDTSRINCINNYYKPGPVSPTDTPVAYRILLPAALPSKTEPNSRFGKCYVAGNIVDGNEKVTADNWAGGVQFKTGGSEEAVEVETSQEALKRVIAKVRVDQPFPMPPITIQTAREAYESVLADAGAALPNRDAVDRRAVEQTRTGKVLYETGKGIITEISQVGGYPQYKGEPDSSVDATGIPRWWKIKYGLNPSDPSVAAADCNGDGYTNIEKYLDGIDPAKVLDFKDPKNNVSTLTAAKLSSAAAK